MSKKHPDPVDIHVGQRVRAARLALGISQEKLAEHFKLSFQQVQKYEKGTNRISASRMQQISVALHRPIAWFFEGVAGAILTAGEPDPIQELGQTREGIAVARAFISITDPGVRHGLLLAVQACADSFAQHKTKRAA